MQHEMKIFEERFHRCCTGKSEANFLLKYMCQIKKNIF